MIHNSRTLVTTLLALAIFIGFAPATLASEAHPQSDQHAYAGPGLAAAHFHDKQYGAKIKFDVKADFGRPDCVAQVLVRTIPLLPPQVTFSEDTPTGVGGACFPWETASGDDTGDIVTLRAQEFRAPTPPVWIACVDFDGDGFCRSDGSDIVDVCTTGLTSLAGSLSLTTNGTCDIYNDPGAAVKTTYAIFVGTIDVEKGVYDASTAIQGLVYLQ
ncbi:MAG TPA: hypothetical protein VM889_10030 [Candidatus Thermoplasmatota archaeon]|nr:hypothetical protein [Candidatus Thermoplasmatota archaeon]